MSTWRKSTYSGSGGGSCVEVGASSAVMVRDTKDDGSGPVIRFSREAWQDFISGLQQG